MGSILNGIFFSYRPRLAFFVGHPAILCGFKFKSTFSSMACLFWKNFPVTIIVFATHCSLAISSHEKLIRAVSIFAWNNWSYLIVRAMSTFLTSFYGLWYIRGKYPAQATDLNWSERKLDWILNGYIKMKWIPLSTSFSRERTVHIS